MTARAEAAEQLDAIGRRLVDEGTFGSIRVVHAQGRLTTDRDGEPVVRLDLTLADPGEGQGTWPLDDVDALQQAAERFVREASFEFPYVVTELYPETPDEPEDPAADADAGNLAEALDADPER